MPLFRVHMTRTERRTITVVETAEVDVQAETAESAKLYVEEELRNGDMELYADWEKRRESSADLQQTEPPSVVCVTPDGVEAEFIVPEEFEILDVAEEFKEKP